jgi:hypothetical protein
MSNTTLIDARGPRFSAVLTTIVLAAALLTKNPVFIWFQLIVFAIGSLASPTKTPYAFIYKRLIKPRLKGEIPTEDVKPPRFAQTVGLGFAIVAALGLTLGSNLTFSIATAFALAAAFLNAAFDFCLGCQIYFVLVRAFSK